MVIVTGSKQSGTSLWMQILMAAGLPPFGQAPLPDFSGHAPDAARDASFETSLRHGIYFATNPSPITGQYAFPEQLTRHVTEMLPFGVTRTDRAFIGKVLGTMRPLREYVSSMRRLHALEDAGSPAPARVRLNPSLEWWAESYALVRDVSIRQYPFRLETQARLLRDPERLIGDVIGWLGTGDAARAVDTVKPEHRRFEAEEHVSIGSEALAVCDELYETVDAGHALSPSFLAKLNETQQHLLPALREEDARITGQAL